jgi:signal transduction histidine kinase
LSALTGGLAHEIRNPLSTMKVNLQLLDEDWKQIESPAGSASADPQDVARRSRVRIANLLLETRRLERILGDFLQFVGKRELKLSQVDLNDIVSELADFYRPQAQAHHIDFVVELATEPLKCRVDSHVLKQSLLNLLINAQQAITAARGGGPSAAPDRIVMRTQAENLGQARIEVIDSGGGIPQEISDSIFQAYFSTKKGGTGLGLATARQIVREHGGTIAFDSSESGGTRFTILLPRAT